MLKKVLMNIKKVFRFTGRLILDLVDDILLVTGISLISIGVFKIYMPAGYITLGICFIAFAFFVAKRSG